MVLVPTIVVGFGLKIVVVVVGPPIVEDVVVVVGGVVVATVLLVVVGGVVPPPIVEEVVVVGTGWVVPPPPTLTSPAISPALWTLQKYEQVPAVLKVWSKTDPGAGRMPVSKVSPVPQGPGAVAPDDTV